MQSVHTMLEHFNTLDLPIGVYVVDPDGRFLACNLPLRQMLKLPLAGDVGARSLDFYISRMLFATADHLERMHGDLWPASLSPVPAT